MRPESVPATLEKSSNKEVSVIIVNFNGGAEILDCLRSLTASASNATLEIVVVDNGSTDGSDAQIATQFPHVKLQRMGENRGFAAACNVGIQMSRRGTILLLNPDTVVEESAVLLMFDAMQKNAQWGIVGARMVNSERKSYRAARRLPGIRDLVLYTTGLSKLFSRSKYFNGYLYGEREIESLDEVEQVEGSCLMISEAARASVGPLDEQFFIFFEEVDWCKRVREAGFGIHVVNEAVVLHHVSTTMGKYFARTREIHAQSAMRYFRKHEGEEGYRRLRSAMKAALGIRLLGTFILSLSGSESARRRHDGTVAERRTYQRGLEA